jgi:succinoglycan biosynthesis transport protein ExoP
MLPSDPQSSIPAQDPLSDMGPAPAAPERVLAAPPAGVPGPSAQEVAPPPALSAAPTPLGLLLALRRRWLLALLCGLVAGVAGAAGMWQLTPPSWKARTKLRVEARQPFIVSETPEVRTDFTNYQRSQVALIKSRLVINRVLRDPEVARLGIISEQPNPVEWLERQIQVDFSEAPEVLAISLNGPRPEQMTVLVNAIREAYLKEIVNREHNIRLDRLDKLQKLCNKHEEILQAKRDKRRDMAENLGAIDSKILAVKHQAVYAQLNRVQNDYLHVQFQIREAKVDLDKLGIKHKARADTAIPAEAVEEALRQESEVKRLTAEVARFDKHLAALKRDFVNPEKEPSVKETRASLEATRKALETSRETLRSAIAKRLREEFVAATQSALEAQKEKLERLTDLEKVYRNEFKTCLKEIQDLSKGTVSLEGMKDEIAAVEEVARKINSQAWALQVEIDAPSRISLLEDGLATQTRDRNSQMRTTGLAGFGLLALGLLGVALWEFRARRVNGVDDVVRGLGMRLFGALPILPARALRPVGSRPRARDLRWQHMLTESVDATRTQLLYAARTERLRVIMVTSALPGEGKTLLSTHLAASLARAGMKTVLVDGDLRRPSLHKLLGQEAGPGLSDLLTAQADLDEVLRPGPVAGLSLLPAGQWNPAAIQALAQDNLAKIFEQLRSRFDFIIVDSAPVLPVADSLTIGQSADGVVFSVLRDVSRLPTVYAAYERLAMLGVNILGAVVGGATLDLYGGASQYHAPPISARADP